MRTVMKPKRTILCVDDNEQSLSYRKIMLETRGYRVASFSRGEDALERFRQGGIDLVVTDMAMPGLDGPQLIAAIKNLSPHVPAILISSRARVHDHESQADVFWPAECTLPRTCWSESACSWCASAARSGCKTGRRTFRSAPGAGLTTL